MELTQEVINQAQTDPRDPNRKIIFVLKKRVIKKANGLFKATEQYNSVSCHPSLEVAEPAAEEVAKELQSEFDYNDLQLDVATLCKVVSQHLGNVSIVYRGTNQEDIISTYVTKSIGQTIRTHNLVLDPCNASLEQALPDSIHTWLKEDIFKELGDELKESYINHLYNSFTSVEKLKLVI